MSRRRWTLAIAIAILGGVVLAKVKYPKSSAPRSRSSEPQATQLPEAGLLATVGDDNIHVEDIEWEAALHTTVPKISDGESGDEPKAAKQDDPKPPLTETSLVQGSDSLKQRLLVTVIERKLLYVWIKDHSEGFDHDNPSRYLACLSEMKELVAAVPEFFSKPNSKERLKARLCEKSLIDQYLHEKVFPSIRISDGEISAYYKSHPEEFKEPQRVIFRQILLATEKAALDIKSKVNRNNFAELARQFSIAPEAQKGGKVGPFSRDKLPTFFDIVFNMQIGEISGIVRSDYGFHIIMLLERLPAVTVPQAEATKMIAKKLESTKRQEAYQSWLTAAMNAIPVRSNIGEDNQ